MAKGIAPGSPEWVASVGAARNINLPLVSYGTLTVANLITDSTRTTGTEGDGLAIGSGAGVWPAATNLITNGGFETNTTGWVAYAFGGTPTLTRTTEQAKFGTYSLKVETTGAFEGAYIPFTTAGAGNHTAQCWIYSVAGGIYTMEMTDFVDESAPSGNLVVSAGVWTKISFTYSTDATTARYFTIRTSEAAASTFYVDGVQVETGTVATPYIETDGGTASRSAARIQAPVDSVDETTMWGALRVYLPSGIGSGANRLWSFGDSANERLEATIGATNGRTTMVRQTSGAGASVAAGSGSLSAGDTATFIFGADASLVYAGLNGSALATAANTSIPTVSATTFDIGRQAYGSVGWLNGVVLWAAFGRAAPTDALSSLLYAWGNDRPQPYQFPRTADLRFLAHFYGDGTAYRYK